MPFSMRNWFTGWRRGLFAFGAACVVLPSLVFADQPTTREAVMAEIREAIETRNYDQLKSLVLWKDAGKIKKRVVRFQLHRSLGRKIRTLTWEDFPEDGMDAILATGKLVPNMNITNVVRVIYDEAPIDASGKLPTSVFLLGLHKGVYRIGLVVRTGVDDDDD